MIIIIRLVAISFSCACSVFYLRGIIWKEINSVLSNNVIKKRQKDQTLKERFMFSKYYDAISNPLLIWYFIVLSIHLVVGILCILLCFIKSLNHIGTFFVEGIFAFDVIWMIAIQILVN